MYGDANPHAPEDEHSNHHLRRRFDIFTSYLIKYGYIIFFVCKMHVIEHRALIRELPGTLEKEMSGPIVTQPFFWLLNKKYF